MILLFLNENKCCGYSLEASRQGVSNECPKHFHGDHQGASNEYLQHNLTEKKQEKYQ